MKILTIIGARPQFVKAAVVSQALREKSSLTEIIVHTGQHFDANMSDIFFGQLGIPKPDHQFDINGGTHGDMTGRMMIALEQAMIDEAPDYVLVFGDTNSTLAAALCAAKLHIPVAHVEAGLRSFNKKMPEEINRICTDHVSDLLFCPTDQAVTNLLNEGFAKDSGGIVLSGDVMMDSTLAFKKFAQKPAAVARETDFIAATLHRQENTDDPETLKRVVSALNTVHNDIAPVICPLHPRTRKCIDALSLDVQFDILDPVGYLEMLWLLKHSKLVITDSGGLQKEAYFMKKYCLTLREQTEWVELVNNNFNTIVGTDSDKIINAARQYYGYAIESDISLYGGGQASEMIADTFSNLK